MKKSHCGHHAENAEGRSISYRAVVSAALLGILLSSGGTMRDWEMRRHARWMKAIEEQHVELHLKNLKRQRETRVEREFIDALTWQEKIEYRQIEIGKTSVDPAEFRRLSLGERQYLVDMRLQEREQSVQLQNQ